MKNSTKILIACGIVTAISTSIFAVGQLMTIDVDPSIKKSLSALFFCFSVSPIFSVFLHHLLNFRRHNIRRQQLKDVGRRRSFTHIPMLDGSSRDAVLADKFRLR